MSAIGLCGTFDVRNYGDLTFPLLARHELQRRLGDVALLPYSYQQKHVPAWPFDVRSNVDFAADAAKLGAVLLGGGDLIHCVKEIARYYLPRSEELHHPTSLWLTPALIAIEQGIPVIWNAPGVPQSLPEWIRPLVRRVVSASTYVAVRDESSRRLLAEAAPDVRIDVVPDTAFGLASLKTPGTPSPAFKAMALQAGLDAPYVIVEAAGNARAETMWRAAAAVRGSHRILVLPIGPVHDERNENAPTTILPDASRLPQWPDPLLLTELIAGSEGVFGDSLHLAIAALAFGVPVFRTPRNDLAKYKVLDRFETVHSLNHVDGTSPEWLRARLGRKAPEAAAREAASAVDAHWDKVADAVRAGRKLDVRTDAALWQRLPIDLEARAQLAGLLQESRGKIEGLKAENAALRNSLSWRITAPLRSALSLIRGERVKEQISETPQSFALPHILRFDAIEQQQLKRQPYGWSLVEDLYTPEHAAALAATFPHDAFKLVNGYDGEKGYAYHVRALVGLGNREVATNETLSAPWRQLAEDLLSPQYRKAMSRLTGVDLSRLRMEVNAFHYGPGAWLGPHLDLADKVVTHVLYFNNTWDIANGGCLKILRSAEMSNSAYDVPPLVGMSAVLVRSEKSWHAVSKVNPACTESRRSVTVTFYRDNAVSTMWPAGDTAPTFEYREDQALGTT